MRENFRRDTRGQERDIQDHQSNALGEKDRPTLGRLGSPELRVYTELWW
jgi:hypothetical protein